MIGRRLRGALGLSAMWAGIWMGSGTLLLLFGIPGVLQHLPDHPAVVLKLVASLLRRTVPSFGLWGAVSGGIFSAMLAFLDRRGTVSRLQRVRVALWGALAGAAPPLLAWEFGGRNILLRFPGAIGMGVGAATLLGVAASLATLELARRHGAGRSSATDAPEPLDEARHDHVRRAASAPAIA